MKKEQTKGNAAQHACSECGGPMQVQNYKHQEKVGRYTVTDASGMAPQCTSCGSAELSMKQLARYQRIAAAVALAEAPRVDGAVVRYARKALGLKQTELAQLLRCAPETISRWENDHEEMPRPLQLALMGTIYRIEQSGGDVREYLVSELSGPDKPSVRDLKVPSMLRTGCG